MIQEKIKQYRASKKIKIQSSEKANEFDKLQIRKERLYNQYHKFKKWSCNKQYKTEKG